MKALIISQLLLVPAILISGTAEDETKIKTTVEKVTVYLSNARLETSGSATLNSQTKTVVFTGLPTGIDENSIQVKANTALTIMSVSSRLNYLQPTEDKEYKLVLDSLEKFRLEKSKIDIRQGNFQEEIQMLQANRSIGGNNTGVSTAELAKMADFFRARFEEITFKNLELTEKEKEVQKQIIRLENQLNQIRNKGAKPSGEIVVQLTNATAVNTKFELSYVVNNCHWVPMYDIRVNDINSKAQITAKAAVYQNTGTDWKNVKLSLSTGNPSLPGNKPELNPWMLYLMNKNTPRPRAKYKMEEANDERAAGAYRKDADLAPAAALSEVTISANQKSITPASYTWVQTTSTNSIFEISIPYTIASDGKPNIVEIQEYNMEADYKYFSAPKLDKDAFLVAELKGWNHSELLPGDANIYFENNFVGKSYFDAGITDDTLSFALGRDNNIKVNRKMVKDFKEKVSISGNYIKQTRQFETEIKNTRKTEVKIRVEDQVPLTTNEELTIEKLDAEDARYEKDTGKLIWEITLKPGEIKKLKMGYSVRYPKSMIIQGF
ncbi:MAG: DUF4139 domain-containing protein [Bacteroidia bacterium]